MMLEPFQITSITYMKCLDISLTVRRQVQQENKLEDLGVRKTNWAFVWWFLVILSFTFLN